MWNSFVSNANAVLSTVIAHCVETAWRYPKVGVAFLATVSVLTVLMWVEVWKDAMLARQEQALENAEPLRPTR
ncbi:MAG TPA: hypothetical protein VH414_07310 [Lichenihabitans sp.]|jgi:hypothetical protein|nr:hypothetical protein [Lichenihabitans sp.]